MRDSNALQASKPLSTGDQDTALSLARFREASTYHVDVHRAALERVVLWGKFRRPRRKARSATWQLLVRLGMHGKLAVFLNDGHQDLSLMWPGAYGSRLSKRERSTQHAPSEFMREYFGLPEGFGQKLRRVFQRGGWPPLQFFLTYGQPTDLEPPLSPSDDAKRTWAMMTRYAWRDAVLESLAFARAGFDIGWCEHGQHWYVRGDVRQTDCPRHKKAGQQARWRRWAERRKRALQRQRTRLRAGASTGQGATPKRNPGLARRADSRAQAKD
jgi:hypothetical protein